MGSACQVWSLWSPERRKKPGNHFVCEKKDFSRCTGTFSFGPIKSIVIIGLFTCFMHWRPFDILVDLAPPGKNAQGGGG